MAALIPKMMLRQLYTYASLENTAAGVQFSIKNRLSDAKLTEILKIKINDQEIPLSDIDLLIDGHTYPADIVQPNKPLDFDLRQIINIRVDIPALPLGKHKIDISVRTKPFGKLSFDVEDSISEKSDMVRIPRDEHDNFSDSAIKQRQKFVEEYTGAKLQHVSHYSFDPHVLSGNIENFTGVAQIPLG
ncbi:MAG: hypothetical protein KDE51_07605, partial [Anaerolineales bacterium]|nr:hypothetical protein [Anaerolineales bacterium]